MKKIFQSMLMVLLAAFLSVSMTACGDDDDDNGNGKMSGWVRFDGKTYNFKYFMGEKSSDGLEIGIVGCNKDFYSMKPTDRFNLCEFEMAFKSDGTLDTEYGRAAIEYDFIINGSSNEDDPNTIYLDSEGTAESLSGVTATKAGDKVKIDGKDVLVRVMRGSDESTSTTTRIDFHIVGTPTWGVFN